jgi:hypothetical protein
MVFPASRLERFGQAIEPANTSYQHDLTVSYDELGELARVASGIERRQSEPAVRGHR